MKTLLSSLPLLLLCVPVLLYMTGCADEPLSAPDVQNEDTYQQGDILSSALRSPRLRLGFTGRDSIGVALKAKVSGTRETTENGRCSDVTVRLSGTGTATHMGRISVFQSHCVDASEPLEFTDGVFTIRGRTGGEISGTYEGRLNPAEEGFGMEANLWIDGGSTQATKVDPEEGRALMRGELSLEEGFTYELDGWLLHHLREKGEQSG